MAKKNFMTRFLEWQNYVHYVLLAIAVYIWHSLPFNEVVEQYYLAHSIIGIFALIGWWALGLLIADTLIHGIFYILPKPFKWSD